MSLTTIDQLPGQETEELLTEYQILLTYLQHGEINRQNFLSNERVVANQKLRELLIRAGFMDLGLGSWSGLMYYIQSAQTSERYSDELTLVRMGFASRNDNKINLTVPQVLALVTKQGPQQVGSRYALSQLREKIIQQFDRQKILRQKLEDQNINFFSFDTWEYTGHGIGYGHRIKYRFNPKKQKIYIPGNYTLDEIELLLHDLGPIIKSEDGYLTNAIGTLSSLTIIPGKSDREVVKLFITVFDNRVTDFSIDLIDFVGFLVQDEILSEQDIALSRTAEFNPNSLVDLLRSYNYDVENLDAALSVVMRLYLTYFRSGKIIDKDRLVKILAVAQQTVEYCRKVINNANSVFNGSNPH